MSELHNECKAFGLFLKDLAREAECYSSLAFAGEVNKFRSSGTKAIEQSTVDRWYNGTHLPEPDHLKAIINFLRKADLLVLSSKDEIYDKFYKPTKTLKKRRKYVEKKRKVRNFSSLWI